MKQSRFHSLIEASFNTVLGFIISFFMQILIAKIYNLDLSLAQNLQIVIIFTLMSVARSYFVRRLFNFIHHKQ